MSAWSKCSRDREDSHLDETDGRLSETKVGEELWQSAQG